jgi:hypothetical protein
VRPNYVRNQERVSDYAKNCNQLQKCQTDGDGRLALPSVKYRTDALWVSEFQFERPGFTKGLNGDDSFRLTLFRRQA